MARVRIFVGIDVGDAVRTAAATAQLRLGKSGADVKWVPPANMHLTLTFLGELDDRDLHGVCRAVANAAKPMEPFRLAFAGIGAFPNLRRPKVLWTGVADGVEPVTQIFTRLEEKLSALGVYRTEDRPYVPHLTLGRVSDEAAGQAIAPELAAYTEFDFGESMVDEVIIYSSEMRRDGPEYAVVGRGPLLG